MSLASNDHADTEMTVEMLADNLRRLDVRKVREHKLDDVIDIIEYLREQALALHEENVTASATLRAREQHLTKREAELRIKQRAVESALKLAPSKPEKFSLLPWR